MVRAHGVVEMSALRNLAALVWLWIRITAVLAAIAFAAGAVLHAVDPLAGVHRMDASGAT